MEHNMEKTISTEIIYDMFMDGVIANTKIKHKVGIISTIRYII
jgi:hypothetical protein